MSGSGRAKVTTSTSFFPRSERFARLSGAAATTRGRSGTHIKHRRRNARVEPLAYPEYRRLWTAGAVSDLGDAVGRIALTIYVQDATGSAILTGSVVGLSAAPYLGLGQWLTARLAARPRRQVLVGADLVRSIAFLAMTLPVGVGGRLALLLLASIATPPFDATAGALVPRIVPPRTVGAANALRTATKEAAFVIGFALGGLLSAAVGALPVVALNGATFVFSALVLARMGQAAGPPVGSEDAPVRFRDGFAALRADAVALRAVALVAMAFTFALVPETLVASFVDKELGGTDALTGVLASCVALTVVAAALLLARPEHDEGLVRQAALVVCLGGAAAAACFSVADSAPVAAIGYLAIGPILATRIHGVTVLAHRIEDRLLAPALSVASGTLAASHVLAGFGGGLCAELLGTRETFVVACVLAGVAGLAFSVRRQRPSAAGDQERGARLNPTDGVRSKRSTSAASDG